MSGIVHIVIIKTGLFLSLLIGTVAEYKYITLTNAQQSSTYCNSDSICYMANNAIDEYNNTYTKTKIITGTHWLSVTIPGDGEHTVHQVLLKAFTYNHEAVTVALYNGYSLMGTCAAHPGYPSYKTFTLNCEKVKATRLKLSYTSTKKTTLAVYDVQVRINTTSVYVKLSDAQQSTTLCESTGKCYPASNAIDGYSNTWSRTKRTTGRHSLSVKMPLLTVHQVILGAGTYRADDIITISLYEGTTLRGTCDKHPGNKKTVTLNCQGVQADNVTLSFTRTKSTTYLFVYEIEVTGKLVTTTRAKGLGTTLSYAEQSSNLCGEDGGCLSASNAIDGDSKTASATNNTAGTHWWSASMSLFKVTQVILKAYTYSQPPRTIIVSLYKGHIMIGTCDSHPGDGAEYTLNCNTVQADKIKLSFTYRNMAAYLAVFEIQVIGERIPTTENTKNDGEDLLMYKVIGAGLVFLILVLSVVIIALVCCRKKERRNEVGTAVVYPNPQVYPPSAPVYPPSPPVYSPSPPVYPNPQVANTRF